MKKVTSVIEFCLLLFPLMVHAYTDGSINLLVRSISTSHIHKYCIELAQLPNEKTVDVSTFGWRKPYLSSSSINACNITALNQSLPQNLSSNTMLILYEHQCKITEQAWHVEKVFGSNISLMIITDRTNTQYELIYNVTEMPVSIPVVVFWSNDFNKLTTRYSDLSSVEFSIAYPPDLAATFRPAVLLIFVLVFFILLCGNLWAADEFKKLIDKEDVVTSTSELTPTPPSRKYERRTSDASSKKPELARPAIIPMTYCIIVVIICVAVGWLLLLFYFPTVMIYILQGNDSFVDCIELILFILVVFCIGAFASLVSCLGRLSYFVPILRRYRTPFRRIRRPCKFRLGPLNLFTVFAMCVSLTLVVIWYVYRHREWAWVLQNILGAATCLAILSVYRLGNMRVITIILIAFLIYDIFFVFITPFIPIFQQSSKSNSSAGSSRAPGGSQRTPSNPSVMEQVALGMGTSGEVVPLSFTLPLFIPESEMDPCLSERRSMLGFGDVILPVRISTTYSPRFN